MLKLKVLAIHNITFEGSKKESAVQIWRVWRPLEELKKHVDRQIDYKKTFIKNHANLDKLENFTHKEIEEAGENLGQYDIIFSSYHADGGADALIEAVCHKYGTKYIIDDDDNSFAIDESNPYWTVMNHDNTFITQEIIRTAKYICTTNDILSDVIKVRNTENVKLFTIPNYIADCYQETEPDNGDRVVIGYFGGSSHYDDMHETNFLPALQKVMNEHKNVYFKSCGIPVKYSLPTQRKEIIDVAYGRDWYSKLFPTLKFDIAVAPLRDTIFNNCKSNIKWQESTRMGAAFVCSDVGPYSSLPVSVASKVENTVDDWYIALTELVENAEKRKGLVKSARKELKDNWRLEKNWSKYRDMFVKVYNDKRSE
jgi:hypothetical protein